MLREFLNNFSDSDCYSLLSREQQDFYDSLTAELREGFCLHSVLFEHLGITLLRDQEIRFRLIERLSTKQIKVLLPEYNGDRYKQLKRIAEEDLPLFYRLLGMEEYAASIDFYSEKVKSVYLTKPTYPLYPYQLDCSHRIIKLIRDPEKKRAMLHLPTGAGKTRTAMNIVCTFLRENPNVLVVWLADTRELCEQAVEEFRKAWRALGSHDVHSYALYGDSTLSLSGIDSGFLVAGLQKLNSIGRSSSSIQSELYDLLQTKTGLIVFDEAHKAIARTYEETISRFTTRSKNEAFLLGLSATPGRVLNSASPELIGENQRLSDFFDGNKVAMKVKGYLSPIDYLVENLFLAKADFYSLDYDDIDLSVFSISSRRCEGNPELLRALSNNDNRNKIILSTIMNELQDPMVQIIVFACTVEHARELTLLLTGASVACRAIDGTTKPEIRAAAIADYRERKVRVLVNYGVLTAGFDAPCTNVALIARPTDSLVQYSQMAGRAMRGKRSGGNTSCRIYTVNDNIPEFQNVCSAFVHWDDMWADN